MEPIGARKGDRKTMLIPILFFLLGLDANAQFIIKDSILGLPLNVSEEELQSILTKAGYKKAHVEASVSEYEFKSSKIKRSDKKLVHNSEYIFFPKMGTQDYFGVRYQFHDGRFYELRLFLEGHGKGHAVFEELLRDVNENASSRTELPKNLKPLPLLQKISGLKTECKSKRCFKIERSNNSYEMLLVYEVNQKGHAVPILFVLRAHGPLKNEVSTGDSIVI